jgi:hypothetical protein
MSDSEPKQRVPAKARAAAHPLKTRFKVTLSFELEVEGSSGLPDWLAARSRSFIVAALVAHARTKAVTLLPGWRTKARIVNARSHARAKPDRVFVERQDWHDDGVEAVRVRGATVETLDPEGNIIRRVVVG